MKKENETLEAMKGLFALIIMAIVLFIANRLTGY